MNRFISLTLMILIGFYSQASFSAYDPSIEFCKNKRWSENFPQLFTDAYFSSSADRFSRPKTYWKDVPESGYTVPLGGVERKYSYLIKASSVVLARKTRVQIWEKINELEPSVWVDYYYQGGSPLVPEMSKGVSAFLEEHSHHINDDGGSGYQCQFWSSNKDVSRGNYKNTVTLHRLPLTETDKYSLAESIYACAFDSFLSTIGFNGMQDVDSTIFTQENSRFLIEYNALAYMMIKAVYLAPQLKDGMTKKTVQAALEEYVLDSCK